MSEPTWTLEEQKAHRKQWVGALRSGKYEQGQGKLKDDEGHYCCLGVLADIAGCIWEKSNHQWGSGGEYNVAPDRARDFVGLRNNQGEIEGDLALWRQNDKGKTFAEIADIIEAEPLGLFTDARTTGEGR